MALAFDSARWEALAAARTRGEVGDGIASVLALLGRPMSFRSQVVSPIRRRSRASGSRHCCRSSPRPESRPPSSMRPRAAWRARCEVLADRLERQQGRRPAEDELLITSGGIEALELIGKAFLDPADVVVVEAPTYLGSIQSFRSFEAELVPVTSTSTVWTSRNWSSGSLTASGQSSSTRFRIIRTRAVSASQPIAARGSSSSPASTASWSSKTSPTASWALKTSRCRACGASAQTSSSRWERRRRRCFPASVSAGRPGRQRSSTGSSRRSR